MLKATSNNGDWLANNVIMAVAKDGTSAKGYYTKQKAINRIKQYSGIETLQDACREEGIDHIEFGKRYDLQWF